MYGSFRISEYEYSNKLNYNSEFYQNKYVNNGPGYDNISINKTKKLKKNIIYKYFYLFCCISNDFY